MNNSLSLTQDWLEAYVTQRHVTLEVSERVISSWVSSWLENNLTKRLGPTCSPLSFQGGLAFASRLQVPFDPQGVEADLLFGRVNAIRHSGLDTATALVVAGNQLSLWFTVLQKSFEQVFSPARGAVFYSPEKLQSFQETYCESLPTLGLWLNELLETFDLKENSYEAA